jgi:hypothetical protein
VAIRVGGARAERDRAGAERERAADHGADVAGVVDSPQRDAARRRRGPALRVDADRPRTGAELGDLGEHVRRDVDAVESAALGDVDRARRPAGGLRGRDQVLALGHERRELVAPAAAVELADLLEGFVV